ncbi:MAG: cupin domain-containing protein [Alphaproteobacteria bacterium]|nr:cupin domain-containing protein [Alphaproteobacteria bacterium]
MDKVNLAEKFAQFSEQWTPKIVGEVDDYHVKIAKLQGEFVWHKHDEEDELFMVIDGSLTIKLRDRDVTLAPGEFFVVPKGVEHLPVAEEECKLLMFERQSVVNTGNVENERTVAEPERI